MSSLNKLIEEFDERFDCECSDYKDVVDYYADSYCPRHGVHSKEYKSFLTHVYSTTLQDAKKALPMMSLDSLDTNWEVGFNDCLEQSHNAIDKLNKEIK